jgi:hypothetical protein
MSKKKPKEVTTDTATQPEAVATQTVAGPKKTRRKKEEPAVEAAVADAPSAENTVATAPAPDDAPTTKKPKGKKKARVEVTLAQVAEGYCVRSRTRARARAPCSATASSSSSR